MFQQCEYIKFCNRKYLELLSTSAKSNLQALVFIRRFKLNFVKTELTKTNIIQVMEASKIYLFI